MTKNTNVNGFDASSIFRGIEDARRISEEKEFPIKLTLRVTNVQHEILRNKSYHERRHISAILRELIDQLSTRSTKS